MTRHFLAAAKWTTALCVLVLSPLVLGVAAFAAYFVVDGARELGRPASFTILCAVIGVTLLIRWRRAHRQDEPVTAASAISHPPEPDRREVALLGDAPALLRSAATAAP